MALSSTTSINAPITDIIAAAASRDVAKALAAKAKGTLIDHSVTGEADSPTVAMTVGVPAEQLPAAVKKFIKNGLNVTITENWSHTSGADAAQAELTARVSGVPVAFAGIEKLTAENGSTTMGITGEVTSSIPFLGPKIAQQAEPLVGKILTIRANAISAHISQ